MKLKLALASVLTALTAVSFSPPANATNGVCAYLDAYPTVNGVNDLLALGIYRVGLTPYQTGVAIRTLVDRDCPRHLFTIQAWMDYYAPGATVGPTDDYTPELR